MFSKGLLHDMKQDQSRASALIKQGQSTHKQGQTDLKQGQRLGEKQRAGETTLGQGESTLGQRAGESRGCALKQGLLREAMPWNLSGSGDITCLCAVMDHGISAHFANWL